MRIAKNFPLSGPVLAVGTPAIVLIAVALMVSVRPHQKRPVPVPVLASVSAPPASVKDGIAALREACSAWLHLVSANPTTTVPRVALSSDADICRFVLDSNGQAWGYESSGAILALLSLIPAGLVLGAAWVAFAARGRVVRALLSRLSPWLSGI